MRVAKYHALGNDYAVAAPEAFPVAWVGRPERLVRLCHRNFGLGSDGLLWGPLPSTVADFGLRIFNPDGSEAEKSGNGLRIFARSLFDAGRVAEEAAFTVETPGGVVRAVVHAGARDVTVDMGRVRFTSGAIPVAGPEREVVGERLAVLDREFTFTAATVGNPHCVICLPEVNEDLARRYGPAIEVHPLFPRRTNVQFASVVDRSTLRIEIWERGAGYTLASGSSSSAAAAVAHRLGLVDREVTVVMPGGRLSIVIGEGYDIRMRGPVTRVGVAEVSGEVWEGLPEA